MKFLAGAWVLVLMAGPVIGQDMPLSQVLIDGAGWQLVDRNWKSVRGMATDSRGFTYLADAGANRIDKVSADGRVSVFAEEVRGIHGLAFGPDGRLYGCQPQRQRIVAFNADGELKLFAEDIVAENLVITRKGTIYCTSPAEHAVYLVDAQGRKKQVDQGIQAPTGITLWPDQGTLVVGDAEGKHLWVFRIEPDGSLAHKEPYYPLRLQPGQTASGAGGMTVDSAGRLYVAGKVGVQVFDPTGRLSGVLSKPHRNLSILVGFGGLDLELLYVSSGDQVYVRKTKAKGVNFQAQPPK